MGGDIFYGHAGENCWNMIGCDDPSSAFFFQDSNEKRDSFPAKALYGVKLTRGKTMMDGTNACFFYSATLEFLQKPL